jgi:TolB-like protein
VCYAHEDSSVVYPEIAWLHEQGLNLWYDEGISAGDNWRAAIGDSLLEASQVLFYISGRSLGSEHCNREINLALDEGKKVVPVYLEDVELTSDLKVGLNRVQALFHDSDADYGQQLLDALGRQTAGANEPRAPASVAGRTPRIAIIPFESLDPTSEHAWLGRMLAQSTMRLLHQSGHFEVVPERDVRRYEGSSAPVHEIRRDLGADYLLEGATLVSNEQLSLEVTLLDAKSGRALWAHSFKEPVSRVISMETALLNYLVGALEVESSIEGVDRGTTNSEAYLAYLQGDFIPMDDGDACLACIETLKRATRLDPNFGEAFTSLAAAYYFASQRLQRPELMQLALENFRRSLEVGRLTPFTEAWNIWSICDPRIAGVFEWEPAEAAMRKAMSQTEAYARWFTDPIAPPRAPLERGYAHILSVAGLFEEAAGYADIEMDRIRTYYPGGWDMQGISKGVPIQYAHARQWEKCAAYLDEDFERRPDHVEILTQRAELFLIPTGRLEEARNDLARFDEEVEAMRKLLGGRASDNDARNAIRRASAGACIRLAIAEGDESSARRLIAEHNRGDLLGLLGDVEGMVTHLERAIDERHPDVASAARALLLGAPNSEEQAQHPRYRALLERINATDAWQRQLSLRVEKLTPATGVRATTLRR